MKIYGKFFILFSIAILTLGFSGCNKKQPMATSEERTLKKTPEKGVNIEKQREKITEQFNNIIKKENLSEINEFVSQNITNLSSYEADKLILEYEKILKNKGDILTEEIKNLDQSNELLTIGERELFFPKEKLTDIKNDKLKEKLQQILKSPYKLMNIEGNYEVMLDYEEYKKYNTYVTDEVKDYIDIKALDTNNPSIIDGTLKISYDELGDMILKVENYIEKYFQGLRYEDMLGEYKQKLIIYLSGIDNTPLYQGEDRKIRKDVLESYTKVSKIRDSSTAFIINKYINIIEENNGLFTKEAEISIVSLVNEALSLLEISK